MNRTVTIISTGRDGLTVGWDGTRAYLWDQTLTVLDDSPARTRAAAYRFARAAMQRHRRHLAARRTATVTRVRAAGAHSDIRDRLRVVS